MKFWMNKGTEWPKRNGGISACNKLANKSMWSKVGTVTKNYREKITIFQKKTLHEIFLREKWAQIATNSYGIKI